METFQLRKVLCKLSTKKVIVKTFKIQIKFCGNFPTYQIFVKFYLKKKKHFFGSFPTEGIYVELFKTKQISMEMFTKLIFVETFQQKKVL